MKYEAVIDSDVIPVYRDESGKPYFEYRGINEAHRIKLREQDTKGRWEKILIQVRNDATEYRCTKCGAIRGFNAQNPKSKWCPNCGNEMEG